MAQDYADFLAINVLNEQQLVSYRSLSRALKVHSNLAKQMLYEFHRKQNEKKPGTIHATYLITGTKFPQHALENGANDQDGQEKVMQSSPPLPSSSASQMEEVQEESTRVRTVMLVRETHLEQAKATFENITGIHVYSLQPAALGDIQVLTECNRKIAATYASEDPLREWKQYGTIQNTNTRRRALRTGPPQSATVSKDVNVKPVPAGAAKPSPASEKNALKREASAGASAPSSSRPTPESEKSKLGKITAIKRQDSSLFKSFAKGAAKAMEKESRGLAKATTAAEPEALPMGGFSDDEDGQGDEAVMEEDDAQVPTGKSKREREAELEAMMDQEDEPMEDTTPPESAEEESQDAGAIDQPISENNEPQETVAVENGRRRGRRRITKKTRWEDEDGCLVTKEESAWESFSEDEPAPKKLKGPPVSSTVNNKPGSTKKGGKPGKGSSIMSFFGKK